jgi:hypothetical protein
MGMYTQYRGAICIDSIGQVDPDTATAKLAKLQEEYLSRAEADKHDRAWVCTDTVLHFGGNGSKWLFIGSEHKDYDTSMRDWINILAKEFRGEGRIEVQYEEVDPGEQMKVLYMEGGVVVELAETCHTCGYGFDPNRT